MKENQLGYTVLELLITISIIGILSSIAFISIDPSSQIESAKVSKTLSEMKAIKQAVSLYVMDTFQFPTDCRISCTSETDPLINSLGVAGWDGPYLEDGLWNRTHAWGGQVGLFNWDSDDNDQDELWIVLDDDAPGTDSNDNTGAIPFEQLQALNNAVDIDQDVLTGPYFRGHTSPFTEYEGAWRVYEIGEQ